MLVIFLNYFYSILIISQILVTANNYYSIVIYELH